MDNNSNTFGQRLEQLLNERRMTQKDLAQKAGVTEAAMSHYIKGDRIPRSSVLARIANALNTSSEFLMEGIPQNHLAEIGLAKRLIARNVSQMSPSQKREIVSILLGVQEE